MLQDKFSIVMTDDNDVDIRQMRTFARLLQEDEINNGSPVCHREASFSEYFRYFRPTESMFRNKFSSKDKRSAEEFKSLKASGI